MSSDKSSQNGSAAANVHRQVWDRNAILKRVNGKPERIVKLIRMYLDAAEARIGALQDHLTSQSLNSLQSTAHALKGVSGNLGAEALMHAVATLEQACIAQQSERLPELVATALEQHRQVVAVFEAYLSEHG